MILSSETYPVIARICLISRRAAATCLGKQSLTRDGQARRGSGKFTCRYLLSDFSDFPTQFPSNPNVRCSDKKFEIFKTGFPYESRKERMNCMKKIYTIISVFTLLFVVSTDASASGKKNMKPRSSTSLVATTYGRGGLQQTPTVNTIKSPRDVATGQATGRRGAKHRLGNFEIQD
jgi:hypothetical protein